MASKPRWLAPLPPEQQPLPVATGPLSQLPSIPAQTAPVRFESTQLRPTKRPTPALSAGDPTSAAARQRVSPEGLLLDGPESASLYSFNIQELYDYDLPNIQRPSEQLTAMISQRGRGSSATKRLAPLADAAAAAAGDATVPHNDIDGAGEESVLRSGDDAANFFARRGNHTPVKFVYLNRAKTGDAFRPYDLVVVSREKVEAEYFTMSANGVAHAYATAQPSEFMSLSAWMEQSTFFNVLQSIRFFRHYLAAKIFRLWRANVRHKLYCAVRKQLAKKLFVARTAFCRTLLEINALCYELRTGENTQLMAPHTGTNAGSIDPFMDEQAQMRAHAAKAFEQIVDKLQALIEKVCKDVTTRAKISDGGSALVPTEGGPVKTAGKSAKTQSMAAAKKEAAERAAAVRQAQTEAQMLGDFIRLTDYMAVSSCYVLVVETAEDFLSGLLQPRHKNGVWVTSVDFGPGCMTFSPPLDYFHGAVGAMLEVRDIYKSIHLSIYIYIYISIYRSI